MSATLRTVNLHLIRPPDLPGESRHDYPRDRLSDEHVTEFAELYAEQGTDALPPLKVVEDASTGELHLAGGTHRLHALRRLHLQWVSVEVYPTPAGLTAQVYARQLGIMDDAKAPKGFTGAERCYSVAWLLENVPGQDDAVTAEQAGVTVATVRAVRDELTESGMQALELRAARLAAEVENARRADVPLGLHTLAWDAEREQLRAGRDRAQAGRELAAMILEYGPCSPPHGEATYSAIRDVLSAAVEAMERVEVAAA
jgi:hypothetical protein